MRGLVVTATLLLPAAGAGATERESRTENEALYEKAEKRWQEIWTLERKER